MNRRSLLTGACLLAVLFLIFGPAASGEETHPCTDIYDECLFVAFTSALSLRGVYEGIWTCTAFFAACMVLFYL